MKKIVKAGIILALTLLPNIANAQKQLEIVDMTDSGLIDVVTVENETEFRAEFLCDISMDIKFKSNLDRPDRRDPINFTVDTLGTQKRYSLQFPCDGKATGTMYGMRILTLYVDGFDKYDFVKFNFEPCKTVVYQVKDPYAKLKNPYFKAIESASESFKTGNYLQAKTQLLLAQQTPEYKNYPDSIDFKLKMVDSLILWRERGDSAFVQADYVRALRNYMNVLKANSEDIYAASRYHQANSAYHTDCNSCFAMGESLLTNQDYKTARTYYERVVALGCPQSAKSQEQLLFIDDKIQTRKERSRFFIYEYNPNVFIGFSSGKCKLYKSGGYFTLRTNPDSFIAMRNEPDEATKPEVNISFGWNHKIVKPVWIFLGPGYTGMGMWELATSELETPEYKFRWTNAISPEAGLIIKFWHVCLKYTFQYRFCLQSSDVDMMGKMRHYVGIGVCW